MPLSRRFQRVGTAQQGRRGRRRTARSDGRRETASLLTSLEDHGAICGVSRDMFLPGLMTGAGGIVYQLLKMNPASALPSVLTLGDFS